MRRHALVLAPLLGGYRGKHFAPDRELISGAGHAVHMGQMREEVRNFFTSPDNQGRLRRVANIRLSGQRMMALAGKYIPDSGSVPPFLDAGRTPGKPTSS